MSDQRPKLSKDVYDAIDPKYFVGTLKDQITVITGAGRGIGQAIAHAFAKAGSTVALLDFTAENSDETAVLCKNEGVAAHKFGVDVTDFEACKSTITRIASEIGPINTLVNCAGGNPRRPFRLDKFEDWWKGFEWNVKGAMALTSLALPNMIERKSGCIINIASRAGTVTVPFASAYSASKAALIRATGCIQAELEVDNLGNDIHLYALHPGAVPTKIQRPADPDVNAMYPTMSAKWATFHKAMNDDPYLCGQTCVFLATGKGKALRGKYFDVEQDIATVVGAGEEVIKREQIYELGVQFLGGLPNDGGMVNDGLLKK